MERGQVVLQNTPDSLILDTGITMYDDVAKINDLPKTSNLFGKSRVYFRCLIQSFADNFDLSFHARPQQEIVLVIIQRPVACKLY